MASKQLIYSEDARQELMRGAQMLSDAVKVTLGPRGRNVIIGQKFGNPIISKDGVTVAKEVELEKPYENMGARIIREAASKTSDVAGDGTTTAIILAEAIFREGLKHVAAGFNPMELKVGMDRSTEEVVKKIKEMAIPVKDPREIKQVATVAANHDELIGDMISQAIEKVGRDGVVTIEESKTNQTYIEIVEGMRFDKGYISGQFITNPETLKAELEDVYILLYEKKLSNLNEILPLLEQISKSGKSLLVVAEDVEGDVLTTLVVNKVRGGLKCAAVKAPGFGERRKAMMEDIAILTGGKFISEDLAIKLENVTLDDLGYARRVVIDKDTTTIVEGAGDPAAIKARMESLRELRERSESDYEREKLQERVSKLAGGVAVIKVGAPTEADMKERKMRVDDALNATHSAVDEGIVPGGGVAYVRCIEALGGLKLTAGQRAGLEIVKKALEFPLRQIAINCGLEGSIVVEKVKGSEHNVGLNALNEKYEDLIQAGILDSAKVTRVALQNAMSVAGMMLITETLITEKPKEKKKDKRKRKGRRAPAYHGDADYMDEDF